MAPTSSEVSKTSTSLSSSSCPGSALSLKTSSGVSKKTSSPTPVLRHPSDLLLTTADNLRSSEFNGGQQPLDFSIRSGSSTTAAQQNKKNFPAGFVNPSHSSPGFPNFARPPIHNLTRFPHLLQQVLQQQNYLKQHFLASNAQRLNLMPHNRMPPIPQEIHFLRLEQQIGNLTQMVNQLAANQTRLMHLPQRVQALEQLVTRMVPHVDLLTKHFSNSPNQSKSSSKSSGSGSQRSSTAEAPEKMLIGRQCLSSLNSLLIPNAHDEVEVMRNDPMTSSSTSSAVDSIMNKVNNNSAGSDSLDDSPFEMTAVTPDDKSEGSATGTPLSSELDFTAGVPRSILSEIFPGNESDTKNMKYILPSHIPIEELRADCKVHYVRIGPFTAPMDIFNILPGEFEPVFRKYRSPSAFSQALFVLHHGSFLAMKSSASERGRNNQRILSNDFIHQLTQVCRFWFPETDDESVSKAVNQKQRNILCSARHCFFYLKCDVCSEAKQETLKALKMKFEQFHNSQY